MAKDPRLGHIKVKPYVYQEFPKKITLADGTRVHVQTIEEELEALGKVELKDTFVEEVDAPEEETKRSKRRSRMED